MQTEEEAKESMQAYSYQRLNQSPTIGKLAEALAKAQGIIKPAKKDSENPFFHSGPRKIGRI